MLARMWRNWTLLHAFAGGNVNGTVTLENSLGVFIKTQYPTINIIQVGSCASRHLSQGNENLCSHENLCMNIQNSFIHHSPKLGTTPVIILQWAKG